MSTVLASYLVGAVLWGGVSYHWILGGFWWRSANSMRLAMAVLCGVLWFPSWVWAGYQELRGRLQ